MARRKDHSRDELKDLILDKSWTIVGKNGFAALTARRIAGEIGYTPGTIYNLFQSMDDLYLAVNRRTLDLLYSVLSDPECNNPKKPPVENMKKMAASYLRFSAEYRQHWLMLFNHRMPEHRQTGNLHQGKVELLFVPLENLLQAYFPPRQSQKRKMAARVLWASVHGLCFLQETGKISLVDDKAPPSAMAEYLIDTFIAGIER